MLNEIDAPSLCHLGVLMKLRLAVNASTTFIIAALSVFYVEQKENNWAPYVTTVILCASAVSLSTSHLVFTFERVVRATEDKRYRAYRQFLVTCILDCVAISFGLYSITKLIGLF